MARPDSFRVGNTSERPWVNECFYEKVIKVKADVAAFLR